MFRDDERNFFCVIVMEFFCYSDEMEFLERERERERENHRDFPLFMVMKWKICGL